MAEFEEILQAIGDFGLFQKLILFGLCFPNFILAFHLSSLIFNQANTGHHCNTDWIRKVGPNLTKEEQLNLTLPLEEGSLSACKMFIPVDWDLATIRAHGLNETTTCQSGWVHHDSIYEATIVTDFDLVCDKAVFVGLGQTLFMAGIIAGCLLFGPFAESIGRQRTTQIPIVIMVIFTVATGLSPNIYLYLAFQFIVGMSYGGFRVNCIILATEWVGVTRRSYASCLSQEFAAVGQILLAVLVYFIRNWRITQFVMAAPIAVVACYIWFIPESARWLLDRGKTEEAKKLIVMVARVNKRTIPDSLLEKITAGKQVERGGIRTLIASPVLTKYFLTITFAWFALNVVYFCLTLNVGKFGLDIFLTEMIFGLSEVPAHLLCIWLLEAAGRKLSLMCTLLVGGFMCLLILAVPQGGGAIAITVLATTGSFFMNWAGTICNVYIQELFPTSIRQTTTGLGVTAARIAGMLSPLLNMLAVFHWAIPTIVFGSLSLTGGALAFLLPETRRTALPDSTEEAEGKRNVTISKKIESGLANEDYNKRLETNQPNCKPCVTILDGCPSSIQNKCSAAKLQSGALLNVTFVPPLSPVTSP